MSPEAEVVREVLAAFGRDEDPYDLGLIADDIEWVNPPDAVEGGVRRGPAGWRQALRNFRSSWDAPRVEVERIMSRGERVLVLARSYMRGRASGLEMDLQQGMLFTVREGQVSRFEWYNDRDAAVAAAGFGDDQAAAGSDSG